MSPRKKSIAEASTRVVLRTLRSAADMSTVHDRGGQRVAYIVPPFPNGERSYIKYVAGVTGIVPGTVSNRIGVLVRAGFLEGGAGPALRKALSGAGRRVQLSAVVW